VRVVGRVGCDSRVIERGANLLCAAHPLHGEGHDAGDAARQHGHFVVVGARDGGRNDVGRVWLQRVDGREGHAAELVAGAVRARHLETARGNIVIEDETLGRKLTEVALYSKNGFHRQHGSYFTKTVQIADGGNRKPPRVIRVRLNTSSHYPEEVATYRHEVATYLVATYLVATYPEEVATYLHEEVAT
jgi:hypothetical protein